MRVIAGTARRMPLIAPKGQHTRPTSDRVKENLFNIIASDIRDARFLDLFSGSGAIGIEALSRGAREVVFADTSKDAINAIKSNLDRAKLTARVLSMCVLAAIPFLEQEGMVFDIIFLDPPYGASLLDQALCKLGNGVLLPADGIVIAECHIDEPKPEAGPLVLQDTREYGNTRLMFYSH